MTKKPRLLLDENIGQSVAQSLINNGYDAVSVVEIGFGMPDTDILKLALQEKRVLITLDKDFGQMIYQSHAEHSGMVLLRLQNESSQNIKMILLNFLNSYDNKMVDKFIVVTEDKIRVR